MNVGELKAALADVPEGAEVVINCFTDIVSDVASAQYDPARSRLVITEGEEELES